jgi:Xaa-Pro aminopeptidase
MKGLFESRNIFFGWSFWRSRGCGRFLLNIARGVIPRDRLPRSRVLPFVTSLGLGLSLLWLGEARALAVMGVGDVVIVASNPAQEAMWQANELPKWVELIGQAEQQVNKAREMVDIVGHPEQFASQALEGSAAALDVSHELNALPTSGQVVDFTKSSWNLYHGAQALDRSVLAVPDQVQVLGETVSRDRSRYVSLASEKALRARLSDALEKQKISDERELALQERTLDALRNSKSQSEIALHQTALAASRQRMEIAAARVKQADAELRAFMGDAALEKQNTTEQSTEASEKFLERALARTQTVEATGVTIPHR